MCARYAFFSVQVFQQEFELDSVGIEPHYNIAPTDVAPVVTANGGRSLEFMQWGLVPSWSKDHTVGSKLINARSETVLEKPSFRNAFKKRRCLVPADGFFEWSGEKGSKQPFYIHMKSQLPFAFAGLWEQWEGVDGALVTFTILTTECNELVSTVHTRMPVIVAKDNYGQWLDHNVSLESLVPLLAPYDPNLMDIHPVSRAMSSPSFESPRAIEPIAPTTLF